MTETYQTPDDLEYDPDERRLYMALGVGLLPHCLAPVFGCCGMMAPVVGAFLMMPALSRGGWARFAAAQLLFLEIVLVVLSFALQLGLAIVLAPAWVAHTIIAALAGALAIAWAVMTHTGRRWVIPGVGPAVFRHLFKGEAMKSDRPDVGGVYGGDGE